MQLPTPEDLKKRRNELGFTQKDLAKRVGLQQSIIVRIESEMWMLDFLLSEKYLTLLRKLKRNCWFS
jgi:predicted transcriptional regulator